MNRLQRPVVVVSMVASALVLAAWPMAALAATQPRLGTATNFAVLGGSTVTNTGPTVITGDLGLSPGSAVTGFPPGVVRGGVHKSDAAAGRAKTAAVTTYNDLASWNGHSMTGDLAGKTLIPGVYTFSSSALLSGTLTLSGNGIYIFQTGSTLTTGSNSRVVLIRGASGACVFWKIGSSATLGSGTRMVGTIVAMTSITMVTGASLIPGRALARTGAVTLDSNVISRPGGCGAIASAAATAAPRAATGTSTGTSTNATTPGLAVTGGGPAQTSPWSMLVLIAGFTSLIGGLGFGLRTQMARRRV